MQAKSNVKYGNYVESVSRKFTLRANKCTTKNQLPVVETEPARYMGGSVRKTLRFDKTGSVPVEKNVLFMRFNPRTSAFSQEETAKQAAFGAASRAAQRWLHSMADVTRMAQAWNDPTNGTANGVAKSGYTFRGWVWVVAYSYAIAEQEIPTNFPNYTPAV